VFGIIRLGQNMVSIYPNNGVKLEINGSITFKGRCSIGNNSFLSVGKNGHAIFGDNFIATTSLKLVAYNKIESQKNVLIGWNCMICDTEAKDYSSIPPYCLLAGTPAKLKKENIGRAEWFGYQI
jgi:acetyltransferase-like isoleucine patch superfamily enzyme